MKPIVAYHKIIDFLMRQPFFADALHKTLAELKISKEDKTGIYPSILDAHIFEPDEKGMTPFDFFLENAKLTPSQKKLYELWMNNTLFSFFEVVDLKNPQIVDIVSNKSYKIYSFLTNVDVNPGDLITTRIVPKDEKKDTWVILAGNATSYPKEAIEILKSELSKSSYGINELDIIKYAYTQAL